ncbi:MAG: carboxypeptidase regulatory-like domain-containing protein [Clostridia bacterium]|nr:carboxypeptidase regulatory-like domain-containing protein [Clostridia bacterium]
MLKKKTLPLLFTAFALLFVMVLLAVPSARDNANAHDIPASKFDPSEFTELTYGIYWYQSGSDVPVAAKDATNYDPTKPTLIYAHGMKVGHEGLICREGLSLKDNNYEYMVRKHGLSSYQYEEEFYQPLIDQGYNVGVFYWNQLADCSFTDECKFWTTTAGESFGYIDENGKRQITQWNDDRNPEYTVTYLYRDCLVEALGKDFSGHLQLVGHSMGGQLTLAVSQALCYSYDRGDISSRYLPDRVTLIDPYIGSRACEGIVDTTGEQVDGIPAARLAANAAVTTAEHGIPIEAYGVNNDMVYRYFDSINYSKSISQEEVNEIIRLFSENITWVYLQAMYDFYKEPLSVPFVPTHTMAVDYYFTTMYMDPAYDNGGVEVPSFKASDDHIRALKGKAFSQRLTTSKSNPLYQNDCTYVRVNPIDYEEVPATALSKAVSGTVKEKEKQLTVKIFSDDEEEVATTTTLKGKYLLTGLTRGDYTIVVYDGNTEVSDPVEVAVKSDDITKVEEINAVALPEKKKSFLPFDADMKIVAVCIGAGILVLICFLIFLKKRGIKGSV